MRGMTYAAAASYVLVYRIGSSVGVESSTLLISLSASTTSQTLCRQNLEYPPPAEFARLILRNRLLVQDPSSWGLEKPVSKHTE